MTKDSFSPPVRQIAYFVKDIEAAALAHHQQFGSGPYFIARNIPLRLSHHRGIGCPLDHSSAYGQWGSMMIEFVQQNNSGPSVFHDIFPEGTDQTGLHHLAIIVDDLTDAISGYTRIGFETALYAETESGLPFAMIDMINPYGHMLELYAASPELTGFYDMISDAAIGFDGTNPLRELSV
ncbi:MAG: VOC family protein [Parasphingorhabdus sp.]